MHPAPSIIAFTVLSGMGYGLAIMLGLGLLDPDATATRFAHVVALGLIAAGLVSSTLHLGNPQRAWRALSQWRTSWLSREGVMAIATFAPLTAGAWWSVSAGEGAGAVGLAGAVMAIATIWCTGMIYASIRAVDAWHTRLTPSCYLGFAVAGGLLLATLFSAAGAAPPRLPAALAIIALAVAFAIKRRWRRRMLDLSPLSTPETATALGGLGRVRLLERPHTNDNYLTREMGYSVARKHAYKLAGISVLLGGIVPAFLLSLVAILGVAGAPTFSLCLLAVMSHAAGMLVERWLFFAEARHAVMAWY